MWHESNTTLETLENQRDASRRDVWCGGPIVEISVSGVAEVPLRLSETGFIRKCSPLRYVIFNLFKGSFISCVR